jgi:putative FmdB family regulatory protein
LLLVQEFEPVPLYEYRCTKCGHVFEKIQKFSDPHVTECPKCGEKVEQVISAPAVQFKGAGWYATDYAKKSSGSKESKGSDVSPSSETKSESKPSDSSAKTEKK